MAITEMWLLKDDHLQPPLSYKIIRQDMNIHCEWITHFIKENLVLFKCSELCMKSKTGNSPCDHKVQDQNTSLSRIHTPKITSIRVWCIGNDIGKCSHSAPKNYTSFATSTQIWTNNPQTVTLHLSLIISQCKSIKFTVDQPGRVEFVHHQKCTNQSLCLCRAVLINMVKEDNALNEITKK